MKTYYAIVDIPGTDNAKSLGPFDSVDEAKEAAKASGFPLGEVETVYSSTEEEEKALADARKEAKEIVSRFASVEDNSARNLADTASVKALDIPALDIALKAAGFSYDSPEFGFPEFSKDGYLIVIGDEEADESFTLFLG